MIPDVAELDTKVRRLLGSRSVPLQKKQDIREDLLEYELVAAAHENEEPFRQFVRLYLQSEHQKAQEGDRDEPLCECALLTSCDLKRANLPARVERADSVQEGISLHLRKHPEAVVLREGQQEFHTRRKAYGDALEEARHRLLDMSDEPSLGVSAAQEGEADG